MSLLVTGLTLPATGASTPTAPADAPTQQSLPQGCTYRAVTVDTHQTQGSPGEYLSAYSKKTNKFYVSSTFNFSPEHG